MLVMLSNLIGPMEGMHAMTKRKDRAEGIAVKALLGEEDYLRAMVQAGVEARLEADMTAALGAEKGERTPGRLGYRAGYSTRALVTRVGILELRVPQDRDGRFSTRLFKRYQRSERHWSGPWRRCTCRGFDAQGQGGDPGPVRA